MQFKKNRPMFSMQWVCATFNNKVKSFSLLILAIVSIIPATTIAEEIQLTDHVQTVVSEIEIKGADRTKEYVIRRELLFREGDKITGEMIRESVQRLKNTMLFSKVLPYLESQTEHRAKLIIEVEEKWTLIPMFAFSLGGGSQRFSAMLSDINTLGRYYTVGAGYENLNGEHSGSLVFRNPRLLDRRLALQFELSRAQIPRSLYQPNGDKSGSYVLARDYAFISLRNEFTPWLYASIGSTISQVQFKNPIYEPSLDADLSKQISNGNPINANKFRLSLELGRLNYDNYLVEGKQSELLIEHATRQFGADDEFTRIYWSNTAHWRFDYQTNLSFNFTLGATTSTALQNLYFVGGLDDVRGYSDGQFRNRTFWKFNAEFRIPSLKTRWLVLQHIFFVDAAEAASRIDALTFSATNIYPSVGIGLRIISPRIYSANGRGDLALPLRATKAPALSIGTQQFF